MGFLSDLMNKATTALNSYTGDSAFLKGVAAAAANVTAADGQIDDDEIESAIKGMQANKIVGGSYSGAQIEEALNAALVNAKTRAGRMENKRSIEALMSRPAEAKQDILLIAADVADNGGIGDDEWKVLEDIGKLLNIDARKFLG